MNNNQNAFRTGIVIILGTMVAAFFFLSSNKSALNDDNSSHYYAYLSDASGITAKSLITVAGLQVGEIENIELKRIKNAQLWPNVEDRSQVIWAKNAGFISEDSQLTRWLKHPGDRVEKEEALCVISTPAGELYLNSPIKGTLLQTDIQAGSKLSYNSILGRIGAKPDDSIMITKVQIRINNMIEIPTDSWLKKESLGVLGAKALFLELGSSKEIVAKGERIVNVRSNTQFDEIFVRLNGLVESIHGIVLKADENIARTVNHVEGITAALEKFMLGDEDHMPLDELYSVVMSETKKTIVSVGEAVDQIKGLLKKNDSSFNSLMASWEQISKDVKTLTAPLETDADGTITGGSIQETMANVRQISDDLQIVTGAIKDAVGENEGDLGTSVNKIKDSITALNTSLENLATLSSKIERGEGTVGRLLTDEKLALKVEKAVIGASEMVESMTSIESHVDLGTWYSFRGGQANVSLGIKIYPTPDKYYFFEVVNDGSAVERLTQTFNTKEKTLGGDADVKREAIWQDDNTIRITAMFAKRFYDFLVLRAGIIETSGGIGIDFNFWDDRLTFRNDFFNWGGPRHHVSAPQDYAYPLLTLPRWRMMMKFQPIPYVYFNLGIDDILNPINYNEAMRGHLVWIDPGYNRYGTDFFLGVGLAFQDDDLRNILPFIPSF